MVIFTTWMKLHSAKYFCNTWLIGLGEIFIQWKFWWYGIKIKLTSSLWLSANPPVNMADMTSQWEQRTSLWLWTRVPSTLNVTSEKGGCGRSIKKRNYLSLTFCLLISFTKVCTCTRCSALKSWARGQKYHVPWPLSAGPGDRSFIFNIPVKLLVCYNSYMT